MKNFIIASHGWSASNWLSYILNKHPQIISSHSAANLVGRQLENDIKSDIKKFHTGYLNRLEISIDDSYKNIEDNGQALVYGSVHLYRLRDLPYQDSNFKILGNYKIFNLVRNPISLVMSGFGQFKSLFKTDINELHWTLGKVLEDRDYLYRIADKYDIKLGDNDNLAFISACRVLGSLRLDLDALSRLDDITWCSWEGILKMEDLTNSKDAVKNLITSISQDLIVDEQYLDDVFNTGKVNKHSSIDLNVNKEFEVFNALDEWKKEVLRYYLEKYRIVSAYEEFGYDLSYI